MLLQFVVVNLITKFTRGKLSTNISLIWRIVGWSLIAKVHGVQFYCLLLNLIKMIVLILIIFIWRLCISYRLLNSIIRSFEPLTPRCTNSIENLGDSYGSLSTSGYHQVNVIPYDQDKLAFFAPYSKNKMFKVIHVGLKNTPTFDTTTMNTLREEWLRLFADTKNLFWL